MTYVITRGCIGAMDQTCVSVCPVDCIYEVDRMLVIEPTECIDCGACLPECPVEAIYEAGDVPADQAAFIAINAAWGLAGREAVEAQLDAVEA